MHCSDHAFSLRHFNSEAQRPRSRSVTDQRPGVSSSAGVTRLSRSQSVADQRPGVSSSAGVTRLSRSHSLSNAEHFRDTVLLQHELHDALQKLDNMKLALAAKVSIQLFTYLISLNDVSVEDLRCCCSHCCTLGCTAASFFVKKRSCSGANSGNNSGKIVEQMLELLLFSIAEMQIHQTFT